MEVFVVAISAIELATLVLPFKNVLRIMES